MRLARWLTSRLSHVARASSMCLMARDWKSSFVSSSIPGNQLATWSSPSTYVWRASVVAPSLWKRESKVKLDPSSAMSLLVILIA